MTGNVVCRTEVYMDANEQEVFDNVINYIEKMDEEEFYALPEGVRELLMDISERCSELVNMIPREF